MKRIFQIILLMTISHTVSFATEVLDPRDYEVVVLVENKGDIKRTIVVNALNITEKRILSELPEFSMIKKLKGKSFLYLIKGMRKHEHQEETNELILFIGNNKIKYHIEVFKDLKISFLIDMDDFLKYLKGQIKWKWKPIS